MMRAVVLSVVLLAGCFSFLVDDDEPGVPRGDPGYDARSISIEDVIQHAYTVTSFDGTELAVTAYEPVTADALPNGSAVPWPVVVFLHPWGESKEYWQTLRFEQGTPVGVNATLPFDLLQATAERGMLAIAYDLRGWGMSGGLTTVAGPAERADLDAIMDDAEGRFLTTGDFGLAGLSYGGGQALLALDDARVSTAVVHQGWMDLYEALAPGNVPKLEWIELLYSTGMAQSRGRLHPMVTEWVVSAHTRQGMPAVESALDARSLLEPPEKPVLWCGGAQDTILRQADLAWGGPWTKTIVHQGGHAVQDRDCWMTSLDWLDQYLRGIDTGAHAMPFLTTVDALDVDRSVAYADAPRTHALRWHLHEGLLAEAASSATFTVSQRLVANPLSDPTFIQDALGQSPLVWPAQFQQDPVAVTFRGEPLEGDVLLGRPSVHLVPAQNVTYQVAATLFIEHADGRTQFLTRGAVADLGEGGNQTIVMEWVKADIAAGDRLVLRLAANDPGAYMPLFADYDAVFTGDSTLAVPFFAP